MINKVYTSHICDCTQCPEYKILIDLPWKMIFEQKIFDFPVGLCKESNKIIQDFTNIPSECILDDAIKDVIKKD